MFEFFKEKQHPDLDSPSATLYHRKLVMKKSALRKLYTEWYSEFENVSVKLPKGKLVEIGSGGGFAKQIIPDIITSDVIELPHCDMLFSACDMPFEDNSVSGIFMLDVLHHIPCAEKFFTEAERVLVPGGEIFMTEPANTVFSRWVYQNLHHEPFQPEAKDWHFPSSGPLSDANGALPWIIFNRDIQIFTKKYPKLKLVKQFSHTPFRYLLTGGLSYKSVLPGFTFYVAKFFERIISPFNNKIGMFQTIRVKKV